MGNAFLVNFQERLIKINSGGMEGFVRLMVSLLKSSLHRPGAGIGNTGSCSSHWAAIKGVGFCHYKIIAGELTCKIRAVIDRKVNYKIPV